MQGFERWQSLWSVDESRLRRLALLRDLAAEIHAQRSRALAGAGACSELEAPVRQLAARAAAGETLSELGHPDLKGMLQTVSTAPARPAAGEARLALPAPLVDAFGAARFERSDRAWENALAREALRLGCEFWEVSASVSVADAERVHRELILRLNAHGGIVLLAESAAPGAPLTPGVWSGRWVVAIRGIPDHLPSVQPDLTHPLDALKDWPRPGQPAHSKRRI